MTSSEDDGPGRSAKLGIGIFVLEAARDLFVPILPNQIIAYGIDRSDHVCMTLPSAFIQGAPKMGRDRFADTLARFQHGIRVHHAADRFAHRSLMRSDERAAAGGKITIDLVEFA